MADSIVPGIGVAMRQREEFGNIWPGLGHADMCEEKESNEIEREACSISAVVSSSSSSGRDAKVNTGLVLASCMTY